MKNEDVHIVKKNYIKINAQIRNKMEYLFKNAGEIERFIMVTNFSEPNIPRETFGGAVWYEDIVVSYGWKVQQHRLPGFRSHYRILDRDNIRRAWIRDPLDIVRALDVYEVSRRLL